MCAALFPLLFSVFIALSRDTEWFGGTVYNTFDFYVMVKSLAD